MSFRLDQLLKASTVRVSTTGKAFEGMGFFFAPGLALTSAHVVTQAEGEMVQVFLPNERHAIPAEVKYRFPEDVGLVILQIQTTEALPCAYLDADIKPGDKGYTFGCTSTSRKTQRVMLECEGMMDGAIGISHLAGRSKQLRINGSPILNQRTGKVCGIVHAPKKGDPYRGEAVPMGVIFSEFPALSILQKEYHCQDNRWTTLLHPDLEALNGDWSYYNRGWIRREQSIRALMFLLRTASQWALIGARMRHVFPWRSIISLIKQTFRGQLGTEIQRQYHYITRQITSNIDPQSTGQARALHRIDAQSWVISSLMEMLLSPEQDYASSSRLLWMLEILQEQRVYIQTMKRLPGNFYPQLENFKRRWKLLEHDEKYIDTSRVLSGLINRNTDTNFSLWYTIKFFLKDFILDLAQNSKLSAHGLERLFNVLVVNLRHAVPTPTASVEDLLKDLEEEVRQNPELKVLQKVQILMTSVSGELVQGGPYRALKGSNTYHFSSKCKLYPERAQAEELSRIICYDTEAEAQQNHKPCKNCLNAEKMLDRRLSDWHDGNDPDNVSAIVAEETHQEPETPAEPSISNITVLPVGENAPLDNVISPNFGGTNETIQVPVTELSISEAPAADAPLPEVIEENTAIQNDPTQISSLPIGQATELTEVTASAVLDMQKAAEPIQNDAAQIASLPIVQDAMVGAEKAEVALTANATTEPTEIQSDAAQIASLPIVQDAAIAEVASAEVTYTEETAEAVAEIVTLETETELAAVNKPVIEATATPEESATLEVVEPVATVVEAPELATVAEGEPAHDIEDVSAQVEVEIAAAIAEVALEIAEEIEQAGVRATEETAVATTAEATPQSEAPTEVTPKKKRRTTKTRTKAAKVEAPEEKAEAIVPAADLLELNTEADDDDDEVAEMASFFVPDGDQPAIALNESAAEPEVEAKPGATTKTRKSKTTDVQATTKTAKSNRTKTTAKKTSKTTATKTKSSKTVRSKSRKQPKTLKDFVSAISSSSKTLEIGNVDASETATSSTQTTTSEPTKSTAKATSRKSTQSSTTKSSTTNKRRKTKVAAKNTPQTSKSIKVDKSTTQATKTPKTPAAKKSTSKSTASSTKAGTTKSTQSKAQKTSKVTRLADWANPEDPATPRTDSKDNAVVSITEAKSARKRSPKSKAKRSTKQTEE